MVEGVKAGGGVGGATPLAHDATATTDGQFIVRDGTASPPQTARASAVAGIGLETMLALQAVDEAAERDRAARRRGSAMLAALTHLQRTMLAEQDPSAAVRTLTELTTDMPLADDPGLAAIIRAVALRSRVELARRGRTGS